MAKKNNAGTAAASSAETSIGKYYLLKAEPESRIEKGKDVKFSVDDFEQVGTSPWEGVRNFEARNIMQEMKVGDKALFYHSNCKTPGIAAFAEVSKEAYPDYTAWDPSHPYYDAKSDESKPKWFMVDLTYKSRPNHFIPLALLRYISALNADTLPSELEYLSNEDVQAIKGMGLVSRGRLSVQRVKQSEWDTIHKLAENGGWEDWDLKKLLPKGTKGAGRKRKRSSEGEDEEAPAAQPKKASSKKGKPKQSTEDNGNESPLADLEEDKKEQMRSRKVQSEPTEGVRRSKRNKA